MSPSGGEVPRHIPVLYNETLSALNLSPGGRYVDGTVGAGGHAAGILALSSPDGLLLGLDRDSAALSLAGEALRQFGERAIFSCASYARMAEEAGKLNWDKVDGILLDLGLSTMQLDDPARGFSFQQDGPLDMRFDPSGSLTAADLVNELPEAELAELLFRYGEERLSRRVARAIAKARPLRSTLQLAEVVAKAAGGQREASRIHPATRTFQAFRIAVNGELEELEKTLPIAIELLKPGGRLAVITFHSLEDRLVKNAFRLRAKGPAYDPHRPWQDEAASFSLQLVNRKPVIAGEDEIARNPRARSAKLRIAQKLIGKFWPLLVA